MGWTPSLPARALSVSRAYAIGLVFEKSPEALASDQYYTSLMAGLQSVLSDSRYSLVTEVVDSTEAERDAYLRLAHDGRVDGMVIVDLRQDDPRFALVREAGLAFVSLGWPPERTTMPVLVYDESQAITDVVQAPRRRWATGASPRSSGRRRARPPDCAASSTRSGSSEHGIDDSRWIESDYTAAGGRAATDRLLDADPQPTAIVYSNDLMAVAGMSAAFSRGLRVPDDISIVGWDDITVSQYLHPALSTVTQHPFEDGQVAATLLLEAIGGREFVEPVWMPQPALRAARVQRHRATPDTPQAGALP